VLPRLVFVHGIGGPRQAGADRTRWITALASGARKAGHSGAAAGLADGGFADVVFADYSHLFTMPQRQGAEIADLGPDGTTLLARLLAEIATAHREADNQSDKASLARAAAQLLPYAEAEGTGDIARRCVNAATTLLGAGPWRRAGQWAGGTLFLRDLAQVARYLARGEQDGASRTLDARIRDVVSTALAMRPAVVIAHSLGSVVSFEALQDYVQPIALFTTLGSPLSMRAVVLPKVRPQPPTTPPTVARWLNYWDRDDIVVARPILEKDVAASISGVLPESERVDSDGIWVHTATKYLAKACVAGPVIEAIHLLRNSS
jgi:hypothetical protein